MNYKKEGISLIVLVITIIMVIILAGSVVLTLSQNNPINSANEAVFKSDLDAIESDLSLYLAHEYSSTTLFNSDNLNADDLSVEYNGKVISGKTIKDIIPALSATNKYNGQFEIINGKLVYVGIDRTKKKWAQEINIEVLDADRLDAIITTLVSLPITAGTDIVCNIKISSNAGIDNINLTNNLELLDQNNVVVAAQPIFEIATPTGTAADTLRTVDVTIKTDTLEEGVYKLKLKANAIFNIYNITNAADIITGELFKIDSTPPTNPIMSVNPTGWTNSDVIVSITYPSDSIAKEYSLDGENWNEYTNSITVTANGITVYARAIDIAGNQSSQSTITIANIDEEVSTVIYGTNGGNNLQVASTKVTVTDVGSGIDAASLKYIWDLQDIAEPAGTWNTFTNDEIINKSDANGTYYLWITCSDFAGNNIVTKSNAFILDNIVPVNPTMSANPTGWTNGNVAVTITYPVDASVKQYSTDAATWNAYTSAVVVSTNGTTIYARATDASGNQSLQSTITIANIDKTLPTAIYGTNGAANLQTASTTVTASDLGGSNISTMQYVWDTQNITSPSSGWTAFTSGDNITKSGITGTYYLWIKVVDNAGNIYITKSNAFVADNTAPVNPTMSANPTGWTNLNVTVTITYPADATVKEYSTNGSTWNAYTSPIVVSTNNTTIYARATDASGNQSLQSSLTVANIDKTVPTVPTVNLNGYIVGTWTKSNITVNLASTDTTSGMLKYQYTLDSGVNWYDTTSTFLINYDYWGNTQFRGIDNAGNVTAATTAQILARDATAPTYTSYTITNISSTGYDVYVYGITDSSSGVQIVQFPTLSPSNVWIWGDGTNLGNGTWYYRVNTATHGGVSGQYYTHVYIYDNLGNLNIITSGSANVVGTIASAAVYDGSSGTPLTVNSTINGGYATYNNPIIPAGFFAVNTDTANWSNVTTDWNNGLVVQDNYSNQFVWVPIDGTNVTYAKWCTTGVIPYSSATDDTLPGDFDESKISSTYKGFYIARYEASNNGGKAASKKASPWNYITYTNAKSYSENMDTNYGYDTAKIGTNLLTGQQWDTVLKWLKNSGYNVETDSTSWGNYYNASFTYDYPSTATKSINTYVMLYTGSTSRNRSKNIYDLAGNLHEWSNEKYSGNIVIRGCHFYDDGINYPAAYRYYLAPTLSYDNLGFRVGLYIK